MKPFNLEEAKAGKPVCTRDGRDARIICFDAKDDNFPIIALVQRGNTEACYSYTTFGKFTIAPSPRETDLFMKPEPTYRPFKSAEEVMEAWEKYGDWVTWKKNLDWSLSIMGFSNTQVKFGNNTQVSLVDAFNEYTFADGTPFGKLVEE